MRHLLVLSLAFLTSCWTHFDDKNDDQFHYCDETGCYTCDEHHCEPSDREPMNNPTPDARVADGRPSPDGGVIPDASIVPDAAQVPSCLTDVACAEHEICCDGECKPVLVPDESLTCTVDAQCGFGVCHEGQCHNRCNAIGDCGTGHVCHEGVCVKPTAPTPVCVFNSQCADAETCINATCHTNCTSDDQCTRAADFCDQGICRPDWRIVSECTIDAHCTADGEQCVDGACRTRCVQHADCTNCPDGPVCGPGGYCQE